MKTAAAWPHGQAAALKLAIRPWLRGSIPANAVSPVSSVAPRHRFSGKA